MDGGLSIRQLQPLPKRPRVVHHEDVEVNANDVRSSSLRESTLVLKQGHASSIYSLAYNGEGDVLASASFDCTIALWSHPSYENTCVLKGHQNAILDLTWKDATTVVSASADRTIQCYDVIRGTRIKKLTGHTDIVNSVVVSKNDNTAAAIWSASDDCTAQRWDVRTKYGSVQTLDHDYQLTAIDYDGDNRVYTGGIDNDIHVWDVRNERRIMTMKGHSDTITHISSCPSQTQTFVLSNSMDGTMRMWDIRPFVSSESKRHVKTFVGATHNAEKGLLNCDWSNDGTMVTGGSADRMVHIWDVFSSEELYCLPGHTGCVNAVVFHPKENIIASSSSDKNIFVGELAS